MGMGVCCVFSDEECQWCWVCAVYLVTMSVGVRVCAVYLVMRNCPVCM